MLQWPVRLVSRRLYKAMRGEGKITQEIVAKFVLVAEDFGLGQGFSDPGWEHKGDEPAF